MPGNFAALPRFTLDEAAILQTNAQNRAPSYGLTLLAGLPFSEAVCARIQAVQTQVEALAPGRFTWYKPALLHATLYAPHRGVYRPAPPLRRAEISPDWAGFCAGLARICAQSQPFTLELSGASLTPDGMLVIHEDSLARRLAAGLSATPGLDQPKHWSGLHVVAGYLHTPRPFTSLDAQADFEQRFAALDTLIGAAQISRVALVHYANRTLQRIVGQVALELGQDSRLSCDEIAQALGLP